MIRLSFAAFTILMTTFTVYSFDMNAYVDSEIYFANKGETSKTFSVREGELTLSHKVDSSEGLICLPFTGGNDADNSFAFATGRAQAYAGYKSNNFHFRLGQFDSMFRFESNHLNEIPFTRQGYLTSRLNPQTHTGLYTAYNYSFLTFKLIFANPINRGTMKDAEGDIGFLVKYDIKKFNLGVGHLMNRMKNKDLSQSLSSLTIGLNVYDFLIDLGFNLYTPAQGDGGTGIALILEKRLIGDLTGAFRVESLSKVPNAYSITAFTIGMKYQLSSNLTIKTDLNSASTKAFDGGETENLQSIILAALFEF